MISPGGDEQRIFGASFITTELQGSQTEKNPQIRRLVKLEVRSLNVASICN
jgi:hypothetical protein